MSDIELEISARQNELENCLDQGKALNECFKQHLLDNYSKNIQNNEKNSFSKNPNITKPIDLSRNKNSIKPHIKLFDNPFNLAKDSIQFNQELCQSVQSRMIQLAQDWYNLKQNWYSIYKRLELQLSISEFTK